MKVSDSNRRCTQINTDEFIREEAKKNKTPPGILPASLDTA
jgi:hypothetical protein